MRLRGRVMCYSVCNFAKTLEHWGKLVSDLAEERGVRAGCGCKVRLRRFLGWEKSEGVLTPKLCNQHKQLKGIPMLPDQATSTHVSPAIREINGFEWEGDCNRMARRALKELLLTCVTRLETKGEVRVKWP